MFPRFRYNERNDRESIPVIGGRVRFETRPDDPFFVHSIDLRAAEFEDADLALLTYWFDEWECFSRVESLDMRGTAVSDSGLGHLCNLKSLRELDLRNTRVTREAVAKLQQALTDCKISF
ncbi:MAG: hypothetical protein KY475_13620 [Planctomycetes bacterium]|nr:hypothetical protein [Planctomycetota bacterium]